MWDKIRHSIFYYSLMIDNVIFLCYINVLSSKRLINHLKTMNKKVLREYINDVFVVINIEVQNNDNYYVLLLFHIY